MHPKVHSEEDEGRYKLTPRNRGCSLTDNCSLLGGSEGPGRREDDQGNKAALSAPRAPSQATSPRGPRCLADEPSAS